MYPSGSAALWFAHFVPEAQRRPLRKSNRGLLRIGGCPHHRPPSLIRLMSALPGPAQMPPGLQNSRLRLADQSPALHTQTGNPAMRLAKVLLFVVIAGAAVFATTAL